MFCFQCEQTEGGKGCTTVGVCGKTPEVAWAQDLLLEEVKVVASYAAAAQKKGAAVPNDISRFTLEALFATLTNVNFDKTRFSAYLAKAKGYEAQARALYAGVSGGKDDLALESAVDLDGDYEKQGRAFGVQAREERVGNEDVVSVMELITYGLKGMAAYADHAAQLGYESDDTYKFVFDTLAKLHEAERNAPALGELLGLALAVGEANAGVMAMLDKAHKESFGVPSPAPVNRATKKGKALLVSGHDLGDLKRVLELTEGTGVNVYTHGEMMPAHGYEELRKHKHLVGNFGGAWQHQNLDFTLFPGPILVTTNCLVEPRKSYANRIYTTNAVGFEGVTHVENRAFEPIVQQALELEGFAEDQPEKLHTVGFGHDAIVGMADTIVQLVKEGKISRFFFIGGCDGTEGERSYFTKLAKATPRDSVILTAGCGKYRLNHLKLGELGETGLPRVLDMGQCNDSYGAVRVALALAEAFGTDVNGLPLSLAVSWFEQKAVAVLLTLLHFGVRDIRLGPALPAFITPNVLDVLVEKFALKPIGDPKEDLANMMKE
eukprot:TRINITY_DN2607_c2_g1_i3.p1 TRINITY_DN2607_c2_g1~~TRINITY_DN2607_c2_g1_i3.p1  ORF type:complete len:549 (-),score=253.37 TRINITY_DN2607_c2_g1_i3:346-1992(-)